MRSIQLDEITWKALENISKKLGMSPEGVAEDLLRPVIQLLNIYLARADVAAVCGEVIDPSVIDVGRARELQIDRKKIKDIAKAAALAAVLLRKYKREAWSEIDLSKADLPWSSKSVAKRARMLEKLGFAKYLRNENKIRFERSREAIEDFIECSHRLESMYGLRTLKSVLEGKKGRK